MRKETGEFGSMRRTPQDAAFAIIGLGRFGMAVADKLSEYGYTIICCDRDAEKVREARNLTPFAYVVEHMSKESLDEIGVRNCDCGIVCIGSAFDVSILTTMYLTDLGLKKVIAKANSEDQAKILRQMGAMTVQPEKDSGTRLADRLMYNDQIECFTLDGETQIHTLKVPATLVGKSVAEVDSRARYGINIIAIRHDNDIMTNFDPDYRFRAGDKLSIIGSKRDIERFEDSNSDD